MTIQKLKYLKILKESYNKGFISKKEYKQERISIRNKNDKKY